MYLSFCREQWDRQVSVMKQRQWGRHGPHSCRDSGVHMVLSLGEENGVSLSLRHAEDYGIGDN